MVFRAKQRNSAFSDRQKARSPQLGPGKQKQLGSRQKQWTTDPWVDSGWGEWLRVHSVLQKQFMEDRTPGREAWAEMGEGKQTAQVLTFILPQRKHS